eukprot:gene13873-biopygen529
MASAIRRSTSSKTLLRFLVAGTLDFVHLCSNCKATECNARHDISEGIFGCVLHHVAGTRWAPQMLVRATFVKWFPNWRIALLARNEVQGGPPPKCRPPTNVQPACPKVQIENVAKRRPIVLPQTTAAVVG